MAIPVNINELLNGSAVESNRIEFKEDLNPTPVLHTICAFANDIDNIGGGYIIIGVEDDHGTPGFPVKGIEKKRIDGLQKKLLELCHFIEPFYEPVCEPMLYEGKYVLVLWCAGGYGRPYKAPADAIQKQSNKYYYIRKFSSSVIASPAEEKELFYVSGSIPFDDRANLAADLEDLDISLIRDHLAKTKSSLAERMYSLSLEQLADDLQLLDGPPERRKPRNVGLLMFSADPQKYFRYARIEVVDIPDATGENMTEKVFTGPLQVQLADALQYVKNYVLRQKVIKHSDRAEADRIWNYPYRAVEEILSNAVYHRSYQIQEPITVRITPDAMEITSYPGFDRSITDADIAEGNIPARIYRNRRIGDFLKELGLIEGRYTGFPNASRALAENGSSGLQFDMDPDRSYLSVTIPVHPVFVKQKKNKAEEYQLRILQTIGDGNLTLTEISERMGYRFISRKLRDTVNQMLVQGRLGQSVDKKHCIRYARIR